MTKKNSPHVFTLIIITFSLLIMALILYYYIGEKWEITSWGVSVAQIMLYYLLFTTFRAATILALSFLEHLFKKTRGEPHYHPLVTIIIPCYNEAKVIEKAIESILTLNYPNYEILVIDDGSFDLTTELAKKFEDKEKLRVIYQLNSGKAEALNRGISEALGEYIVCMDADSLLGKNTLMNAMAYFVEDPTLGALAGSVRVGNSHSLLTQFQKLEYIIGLNFHKKGQSFLNTVAIVPGPIGIFKRDLLLKIGGYRSNTFAEDCDLSMRILLSGHQIKYAPDVVADTEAPDTFQDLMVQRYRWSRGMVQAIAKNLHWLNPKKINFRNLFILGFMGTETIVIPMANFLFGLLSIQYALMYGTTQLMGAHFLGLVELDLALSLYAISTERNIAGYFLLSIINRITYGFSLEIMRFFAIIDEMFQIPMRWGTIERKGMG